MSGKALAKIHARTWNQVWIRPPLNFQQNQILKIIGGNLLNGVQQIQYIAEGSLASITTLYNPDVDTSYIDGIGNAWLYDFSGRPQRRVLVRHNCDAYMDPVPIGRTFLPGPTVTLTVASGPSAGQTMQAYTLLRG